MNESSVSNLLPAVDFLIDNGELSVIDTDEEITQLTLTCSKSTVETLEKGVKYIQS